MIPGQKQRAFAIVGPQGKWWLRLTVLRGAVRRREAEFHSLQGTN